MRACIQGEEYLLVDKSKLSLVSEDELKEMESKFNIKFMICSEQKANKINIGESSYTSENL